MNIERFFILANRDKDPEQVFSKKIEAFLAAHGKECRITYTEEERQGLREALICGRDCLLVLGGDGTVLEGAHLAAGTGAPILGINLGKLGYLAEIESANWEKALRQVLDGDYEIESRMMLEGFVSDPDRKSAQGAYGHALNDIVITRNQGLEILDFDVYVDGQFLNRLSADGMIVATATGSTAYSMSAGGPIVEPKARLILLTAISPHTFRNRSIVLSADDRITIEMRPGRGGRPIHAECVFDGSGAICLEGGSRVSISRSEGTTRLLRLSRQSFLETLHRKFTS